MTYSDMSDKSRWHSKQWAMAEQVFEAVWPHKFIRRGLNRDEISIVKWSPYMRYMPDYADNHGWVEVKGFGRQRLIKIKDDNRLALNWYAEKDAVRLFLWDLHLKQWAVVDWRVIDELLDTPHTIDKFPEGKPYGALHVNQIEAVWHHHDPPQENLPAREPT